MVETNYFRVGRREKKKESKVIFSLQMDIEVIIFKDDSSSDITTT